MKSYTYLAAIAILFVFGCFFISGSVQAASYSVDTIQDGNTVGDCTDSDTNTLCSLREAVMAANDNTGVADDITFSVNGTFALSNSLIGSGDEVGNFDITDTTGGLTITGISPANTIIDAAAIAANLFVMTANTNLTISEMTLTGGNATGDGGAVYVNAGATLVADTVIFDSNTTTGNGGAVFIDSGTATIRNALFTNNSATGGDSSRGGAIQSVVGTLDLINTTMINNSATDRGGGVDSANNGVTNIVFSTIMNNDGDSDNNASDSLGGGGVTSNTLSTTIRIKNSIIAQNTDDGGTNLNKNCGDFATITSEGYNIDSGTDCDLNGTGDQSSVGSGAVLIGALADNGGATQTRALQTGSIAIDAIPEVSCTDITSVAVIRDQRGLARPDNTNCDIGAYELDQTAPVISITNNTDEFNIVECAVETFTDPGATATDSDDDVYGTSTTASPSGSVSANILGDYTITYTATDHIGHSSNTTRTVTVQDTTAPTITISGDNSVEVSLGSTYTDAGAIATDGCDASVSVNTINPVDTSILGDYTVTYTSTDDSDNIRTATRTVSVVAALEDDTDEEDDTENGVIEIGNDGIDNDGDGEVDEVNTIEENGVHPTYGTYDPENAELANAIVDIASAKNGKIRVTYADQSVYTYSIFSVTTDILVTLKQYSDTAYIFVLNPSGKRIAWVNAFDGSIVDTKIINKKRDYKKHSLRLRTIEDQLVLVITSKQGKEVQLSVVQINILDHAFAKKSLMTLTNKHVDVAKTLVKKKKIFLRNSDQETLYTFKVTDGYQLER